jgi:hypothetical protein
LRAILAAKQRLLDDRLDVRDPREPSQARADRRLGTTDPVREPVVRALPDEREGSVDRAQSKLTSSSAPPPTASHRSATGRDGVLGGSIKTNPIRTVSPAL